MYEDALRAAPAHKDAPAAAINSAFCYKQVGEFNKAIELYQLSSATTAARTSSSRLQNGGRIPRRSEGRRRIRRSTRSASSTSGWRTTRCRRRTTASSRTSARPSRSARSRRNPRFDDAQRVERGAHRDGPLLEPRRPLEHEPDVRHPRRPEDAPADREARRGRLPAGELRLRPVEPDGQRTSAGNAAARIQAIATLDAVPHREQGQAGVGALRARVGVPHRQDDAVGGRPGVPELVQDDHRATGRTSSRTRHSVAAADGKAAQIRRPTRRTRTTAARPTSRSSTRRSSASFDYATGHHHYTGNVGRRDQGGRQGPRRGREEVATRSSSTSRREYGSFEWAAAATARIGTLYDSIRTGLDLVVPKYFTPTAGRAARQAAERSPTSSTRRVRATRPTRCQQAIDDTKDAVRSKWRATKDQYLEVCNQKMVGKYVTAALIARKYNVKDPAVQNAVARLAFFTDYLGDDKMKAYVENTPDPLDPNSKLVYVNGEFLQWRSGVVTTPPAERSAGAAAGGAVRRRASEPLEHRIVERSGSAAAFAAMVVSVGRSLGGAAAGAAPPPEGVDREDERRRGAAGAAAGRTRRGSRSASTAGPPAADTELTGRREGRLRPRLPGLDGGRSAGREGGVHATRRARPRRRPARATRSAACSSGSATRRARSTRTARRTRANSNTSVAMGAYALLLARTGHGPDAEQFLARQAARRTRTRCAS